MRYSPLYFMQEALKVAAEGLEKGEMPIGAVVVLNDQIIARAHTSERTERRMLVHAELLALQEADYLAIKNLAPYTDWRSDVSLFSTLEPCLMCMGAAMSFFLGKIYYALESPSDGAVELVKRWQRKQEDFPTYRVPHIESGLLRQESLNLIKTYVARHSSGAVWTWAKTLINTLEQP